jgi:hypothetical protein
LLQQKGVEAFMSFYEIAARDPLMPHDDALIALSTMAHFDSLAFCIDLNKSIQKSSAVRSRALTLSDTGRRWSWAMLKLLTP